VTTIESELLANRYTDLGIPKTYTNGYSWCETSTSVHFYGVSWEKQKSPW